MGAHVRDAGGLEDGFPVAGVGADRQRRRPVAQAGQHVGRAVHLRRGREQAVRLLAHGLGHVAGLAVGPDHSAVLQIDPGPLQGEDFRHARGELELQPDAQRDDVRLHAVGFDLVEGGEQPAHFLVGDQAGRTLLGISLDVAARVGAVRAVAPDLGHVEHLAQAGEGAVGCVRDVRHLLHQRGHVGALDVLHLHAAQHGQDVAVDDALVAVLGIGLVAHLRVIGHEARGQFLDRRGLPRLGLGGARVATPANLGQPVLRQAARLLDGQLPEQAQRRLAAFARIGAVLEHEHLAPGRCNLAEETGHLGIPQLDGLRLRLRGVHDGLGELELGHDDSLETARFPSAKQEPSERKAVPVKVSTGSMLNSLIPAENSLWRASAQNGQGRCRSHHEIERLFLLPSESDEKFKKSLIKQIPGTESTSSIFPVAENKAPGA